MLVLCNGMARSASTWSFVVTKALIERCFPGEEVLSGYTDAPVQLLRTAGPRVRHVVIKCHFLTPLGHTLARTHAAKVVFTIRDVGDAVVSAMSTFRVTFEEALDTIKAGLEYRTVHNETGNAVILEYQEIVANPRHAVRRIGEYLVDSRLTAEIVDEVAAVTSFDSMRRRVEEIGANPELPDGVDPDTRLHRNHMGDGRSGKGRELLSAAQLECIEALTREYVLR